MAGTQQHYFQSSPTKLALDAGDVIFAYVLIDPCKPPRELMLQFAVNGGWNRAYWGENLINWGTNGTVTRWRMGDLPAAGEWVRLEIPASVLGLEEKTIDGMAFTLHDGNAWFDHVGKAAPASGSGIGDNEGAMSSGSSMGDAADAAAGWSWGPISLSLEADLVSPLAPHPSSLTTTARVSIYLPELQLMSESTTTAAPAPAWDYVWFGGQPLAQIEVATGAVRTYFNDHLGTPILQTGEAGTVVWRIEHEPYGEDHAFRAGADLHQPLRFPGQEREVAGELAYNVFRWYRGGWGRYSQADPIGIGRHDSATLYGYTAGAPTKFTDPRGLYSVAPDCDRKTCGPPTATQCYNNPSATICLGPTMQIMRDRAIRNSGCKAALIAGGVDYDKFTQSLSENTTKFPLFTCDQSECTARAHYYPVTKTIPLCPNLFGGLSAFEGAAQSLFHEFLHHFGISHDQNTNVMDTCFPGFAP
jgi:RHS repeat-associated protein